MAPKKSTSELPSSSVTNADPVMPISLSSNVLIEIEKKGARLVVSESKISGAEAYRATIVHSEGPSESCIALCKRSSQAKELFKMLTGISHKNILKPIGVWEENTNIAYIVFPNVDGVLGSIERKHLFELEDEQALNTSISSFSDHGCSLFGDIIMTVEYVNGMYEKDLPLRALKLEKRSIFYQLKSDDEYHILLADFKMDSSSESGRGRNRGRASNRAPNKEDLKMSNWAGLSKCLDELCVKVKDESEIHHLVKLLAKKPVNFIDLVWAPALWSFWLQIQFLREVYWCYDKNGPKISQLKGKNAIGLLSCINKMEVNKSRDKGREIEDKTLYDSLFFLRVYLVAHQDDAVKGYKGSIDVNDKRSIGRLLTKEKPDYMVKIVQQVRQLNWIQESPFVRRNNAYMKEFYPKTTG